MKTASACTGTRMSTQRAGATCSNLDRSISNWPQLLTLLLALPTHRQLDTHAAVFFRSLAEKMNFKVEIPLGYTNPKLVGETDLDPLCLWPQAMFSQIACSVHLDYLCN